MHVSIYIETTLAGPTVKDGAYGAVVEYITPSGRIVTREVSGKETQTTWHRSALLAVVKALEILTHPCEVTVITSCRFIANMINSDNVEHWKREEWKKSSGEDVKHKELWQQYAEYAEKHRITAEYEKKHKYSKEILKKIRKK